ncbi:MAG: hypothetical protein AAF481_01220 [Acidobacteriota bacterium]
MAEMGKYCKAYLAKQFRAFANWQEKTDDLRKETQVVDGKETEIERSTLEDDDILYLQENYTVTDGIFVDEHIIFDDLTDEWKAFCHDELDFEIPHFEPIEIQPAEPEAAESASA